MSEIFGSLPDGRQAHRFTLQNSSGMRMVVSDYGCRILELWVPDRDGELGDVVLGHRTLQEYFGADFHGSFVGRYANRIGKARFSIGGKEYNVPKNDGENSLHGGYKGYHQVLWDAEIDESEEPSVIFKHISPDGDEGFPGELKIEVKYTLRKDNTVELSYHAESSAPTVFNPTNHSFFNLSGDPQSEILGTSLLIDAEEFTEVSDDLIPTGRLLQVGGTPLDFRTPKTIGEDISAPFLSATAGYDHNFCLKGCGYRKIAEAQEPISGRVMEVFTDMPGVQLYTFNTSDGPLGKDGMPMKPHTAFCLETQFYPDSPNHPEFPFKLVTPGEPFYSKTAYRFSVC